MKTIPSVRFSDLFNKLFILFAGLFLFSAAQAQVTIPSANTNSSSSVYPYGTNDGYLRTALLLTASEIGTTGTITSLGFYVNSIGSGSNAPGNAPVRIYLKETTTSAYSQSTYATRVSGATLVYEGTINAASFTANSWVSTTLDLPFKYSGGTNNLEVLIETNVGNTGNETSSAKSFRWNTLTTYKTQTWAQDYSAPTGNGTITKSRPNIRLSFYSGGTAPVITRLVTKAGCNGSRLIVNGINLSSATSVKIGGTAVSSVSTNTATQIIATVGSGTTGTVSVTNATGTATSAETFTYYSGSYTQTWAGAGSGGIGTEFNNPANWSPAGVPGSCSNLIIDLSSSATIQLTSNSSINNLTFTTGGSSGNVAVLDVASYTLTVNGSTTADITSGTDAVLYMGVYGGSNAGIIDFKGNVSIGASEFGSIASFVGNSNSKLIFRGNLYFGIMGSINLSYTPQTTSFDGTGTQEVTWDNAYYYARFNNLIIGETNNPTVTITTGLSLPDNVNGNITINGSSVLNLGSSQLNRNTTGGTFTMNSSSTLILKGSASYAIGGMSPGGFTTSSSNFPAGFSTYTLAATSTVEYQAAAGTTQTLAPASSIPVGTYGNLTLSNPGSGTATRLLNSNVAVSGTFSIGSNTVFTPAAATIISGTGTLTGSGTLQVTRTASVASLTSQYTISNKTLTGLTVEYKGNAAQKIDALSYNNLVISSNGTRTVTFDAGTTSVSGLLSLDASTTSYSVTNSTIHFNGSNQNIPAFSYYSVKLGGSGTKTATGSFSITDSLQVGSGVTLAVGNQQITLKSNATKTARVAESAGTITYGASGKFVVEQYIPARRAWRLITFPISSTNAPTINTALQEGSGGTASSNPNPGYGTHITGGTAINGYDQSPNNGSSIKELVNGSWVAVTSGTNQPITNKAAYFLFVRGSRANNLSQQTAAVSDNTTLRVSGQIKTGNQSATTSSAGWQLVSNPYPSAIDLQKLATTNSAVINNNFKIWDPKLGGSFNVGGFVTVSYNGSSYDMVPAPVSNLSQYLQSGSAFFIDAKASGTIQFTENHKTPSGNQNVYRGVTGSTSKLQVNLKATHVDGSTPVVDGIMVAFNNQFSNELDELDARKLNNSGTENLSISTHNDRYTIERRSNITQTDTVVLQLANMASRVYQLEITGNGFNSNEVKAWLEDVTLGTRTPLTLNSNNSVSFTLTAGYNPNRFRIIFSGNNVVANPVKGGQPSKKTAATATAHTFQVYPNPVSNHQMHIQIPAGVQGTYLLRLTNMNGELVQTVQTQIQNNQGALDIKIPATIAAGTYVVELKGENGSRFSQQIILL